MPQIRYLGATPLHPLKLLFLILLSPLLSLAQLKTISGTVTDESGSPLPSITVTVVGGKNGTSTDDKGHFSISAAAGATLVFSSAVYETTNLKIGGGDVYNISLKLKVGALTDVVVVGYG